MESKQRLLEPQLVQTGRADQFSRKVFCDGMARIVQDGRDLYQQAKCYRVQARELELRFPQSAEILRQLAKWLESEAQHDQLEAEIVP